MPNSSDKNVIYVNYVGDLFKIYYSTNTHRVSRVEHYPFSRNKGWEVSWTDVPRFVKSEFERKIIQ